MLHHGQLSGSYPSMLYINSVLYMYAYNIHVCVCVYVVCMFCGIHVFHVFFCFFYLQIDLLSSITVVLSMCQNKLFIMCEWAVMWCHVVWLSHKLPLLCVTMSLLFYYHAVYILLLVIIILFFNNTDFSFTYLVVLFSY